MVRLKHNIGIDYFIARGSLNSTMVRLKHFNLRKGLSVLMSLNSTMVRLKLKLKEEVDQEVRKSQFHYGSIKTLLARGILQGF